ncbi:hypothetical protein FOXB_06980 [Fusarium oxysporum f. sp. conglutinans Fo5176]|uniref:Uncharacterized protein n=1 Tax=Fusarium oxysporum (strain Fo5176) TaxID=660025 RepID=F9FKQ1_FUSOF|nr:hypothetical protein FOXB_06980 [Fusarium oxysporum f. sp. conglutinans Fo5176]KAH7186461.1 hypothetical protein BKA60DRAFT_602647 [Fusarium oxysporum]
MALPNPTVRDWKGDKHKVMLSDSSVKMQKLLMELQLRAVVDLMRHKHLFVIFTLAKKDLKYS